MCERRTLPNACHRAGPLGGYYLRLEALKRLAPKRYSHHSAATSPLLRAARPLASSSPRLIGDLGTLGFPTLRRQSTLPPHRPTLPARLLALPALPASAADAADAAGAAGSANPTLPAAFFGRRHTCSGRSLCVYLYKMLNCALRQPSLPAHPPRSPTLAAHGRPLDSLLGPAPCYIHSPLA